MRYFIYFSYDGTNYHGWQIQPNANSVQEELQNALTTLLRKEVEVVGAGRTDTGVHARFMAAHFDFDAPVDCHQLKYKLNRLLPRDIAVSDIEQVADDKHARFSAVSRTYRYYVTTRKDPFNRNYSWQTHFELDFALMNEAAALLRDYEDFGAFCKSHSDVKTTLCDVMYAKWHQTTDDSWYFEITANRFLRNMVRAIVGSLIEVGRGKKDPSWISDLIASGSRSAAGQSVPGNALFFTGAEY